MIVRNAGNARHKAAKITVCLNTSLISFFNILASDERLDDFVEIDVFIIIGEFFS